MLRRFFNFLSVISLVLCITTIVCWGLSELKTSPALRWGNSKTAVGYNIVLFNGALSYHRYWGQRPIYLSPGVGWQGNKRGDEGGWDVAGFHFHRGETHYFDNDGNMQPAVYGHDFEFWFELIWPLLISLPLSGRMAWTLCRKLPRRAARIRAGLCPACGYDLRATPDRCPECGAESQKE